MNEPWTPTPAAPEQLLPLLLAAAPDCAVFQLDAAGRVSGWGASAERLFGYAESEILGRPFSRLRTPEDAQAPLTESRERWLVRKDGSRLWAFCAVAPLPDVGGGPRGFAGAVQDRAARQDAELIRSRLAAIVESSDDAIIGKSLDGVIVSWNRAAERLYGYTAAEVVGRPLAMLVPPGQADELPGIMERLKRGEVINHYETMRVRKDGSHVEVTLSISPVRDGEGRVVGAAKIARDSTERRKAERRQRLLAESGALLTASLDDREILESVARLLVPSLADFCLIHVRDPGGAGRLAAASHLDPRKDERLRELGEAPVSDAFPWGPVARVLRTGVSERVSLEAAAGRAAEILSGLAPRSGIVVPLSARGKTLGAVTLATAESGRVYDEPDREFAEELAGRVALAVDNARLYRAIREADRRKDDWIAMMAHELRNPLAPLLTGLHVLRRSGAGQPAVEQAGAMMERQVRHMARLVDDLLDASRVARGKIQLRRERLDLSRLVRTTASDRRSGLTAAGLAFTVTAPETPVWTNGDATRLAQIVGNLLDNAAKFTDRGGRVDVSLKTTADRRAELRVRDTGVGIEAEVLPHLFEPFSQADRSLDRTKGGLGLGLSLVRGLAAMHGGSVQATSAGPGGGAEFVVRLPLVDEPPVLSGAAPGVRPGGERRRVLVVEDNKDSADTLRMLLELMGHEVRVAYTGPDGVRQAEEWRPTVVVSDIGLPGLDGFGVARALRGNPATAQTRLIAVTGYGSEDDRRMARESGFDHLLTKPADPGALQELLLGAA